MCSALSVPRARVLVPAATACAGAAALAFLAWRHRRQQCAASGGAAAAGGRWGASGLSGFSPEEEVQRCDRLEEIASRLRSLGGNSLRGHTMGGPSGRGALPRLSDLLAEYRGALADDAARLVVGGLGGDDLRRASRAIRDAIAADRDRHLVLEVGAGRGVAELDAVAAALSDVVGRYRREAAGRLGADPDTLEGWARDRAAAWERFKEHMRQCLKAANPWVAYD
ncbi:unnamed protein product [Prorocentrum cordatum]|uniref:Uncharacterized protein n=1 Tax=Prorocentrum cordatum TaxID=2364126 RepID=A0ABN9QP22_9DINO|nr:unnamed protein product [Polarella glacialis]